MDEQEENQVVRNDDPCKVFKEIRSYVGTCDVVINVEGESFRAHHVVLASASPVLHKMLTNGMRETRTQEITIGEMKASTWQSVLDYMYYIPLPVETLEDGIEVLECARRFQLESLEESVTTQIASHIKRKNCCRVMGIVDLLGSEALNKKVMNVICEEFKFLSTSELIAELTFDELVTVVSSTELMLYSEMDVIHAIMYWLIGNGYVAKQNVVGILPRLKKRSFFEIKPLSTTKKFPDDKMEQLMRYISPEKMNFGEVQEAARLCRAANLGPLLELCVEILINPDVRTYIWTSRKVPHLRNIPETGFDRRQASDDFFRLGKEASNKWSLIAAERLFREALYLERDMAGGEDHENIAESLYWIGSILFRLGELDKADATLQEGLEMYQRIHGKEGLEKTFTSSILYFQSQIALYKDDLASANAKCKASLELDSLYRDDCEDNIDTLDGLLVQGDIALAGGDVRGGEKLIMESLARSRNMFGMNADRWTIAAGLLSLARVRLAQCDFGKARKLCEECMEMSSWLDGADTDRCAVAQAKYVIACVDMQSGNMHHAVSGLKNAVEMLRRVFKRNLKHPLIIMAERDLEEWSAELKESAISEPLSEEGC